MSRSIHTTRRTLAQLRRQQFSDPGAKAKLLRKERQKLHRKRRIKAQIHDQRHQPAPPLEFTAVETLPIEVLDQSDCVHYPLSPEDLRSLLAALPMDAAEGISQIQLCLGKAYMDEESKDPDNDDRDPWTGRLGSTVLPGVYAGDVLGTYHFASGRVELYAYVYERGALNHLPLPVDAATAYLRLHALKTFVHEVAHHHDQMTRTARGRWLADRSSTIENYAERMEFEWTEQIGIPWLEHRFPCETAALKAWIREFGGVSVPMSFFAGDPRVTGRDGLRICRFSTTGAFERFVEELAEKPEPLTPGVETRVAFAWEVHFSDQFDLCLRILNQVLTDQPEHLDALACKADTLVHLERFDEAWNISERILEREPSDSTARRAQLNILEAGRRWPELLEYCAAWERAGLDNGDRWCVAGYRAVACCALERWDEMESWIASRALDGNAKYALQFRLAVFRRAGKPLPEPKAGG